MTVFAFALGAAAEEADVDARFAAMQARIEQLEQKLAARARSWPRRRPPPAPAAAALPDVAAEPPSFFDTINVSGFVAASYFYNFNDPDGGDLGGNAAVAGDLLHPDANSFSLDQVWMTISRDASEEQRAGFKADFVYGKTASLLSADNVDGDAGNDFDLYQGYLTYLAPLGEGVTIQAGKFATLLGAEVAQAQRQLEHHARQRLQLHPADQPHRHSRLDTDRSGQRDLRLRGRDARLPGDERRRTRTRPCCWSERRGRDAVGLVRRHLGPRAGRRERGRQGSHPRLHRALDAERRSFGTYVNFDYLSVENSASPFFEFTGYGMAAAARYAFTENTGLAGRFEWVDLKTNPRRGRRLRHLGHHGHARSQAGGAFSHCAASSATTALGRTRPAVLRRNGSTLGVPRSGQVIDERTKLTAGVEVIYGF